MFKAAFLLVCCSLLVTACGKKTSYSNYPEAGNNGKATQRPYTVYGQRYEPVKNHKGFVQSGVASWYGRDFHGKKTSNGERYDMNAMTAAHKTLPLGIYVKVVNKENGREAIVRLNDRGPFVRGRIIDLSYSAAKKLGVDIPGTAPVKIEALGYRQDTGRDSYSAPGSYDSGNYTVQIGSFKDRNNAQRLSDTMRNDAGFSEVRRTSIDGEVFYRVFAGKYSSLKAAEAGEREFGKSGYPGSFVVALD